MSILIKLFFCLLANSIIGSIVYMIVCLLNGLTRKQENTAIYYYLLIGTSLFFVIPFFLLGILPMLVFKNGGRLGFLFNQTTEINVIVLFGIAVWGAGFAAYILDVYKRQEQNHSNFSRSLAATISEYSLFSFG